MPILPVAKKQPKIFRKKSSTLFLPMNNAIEVEDFQFNQEVRERKRKELQAEETINLVNIGRFNTQKKPVFFVRYFCRTYKTEQKV